ncbi:MAG: glucokinase [Anaerolineae bacterium]|nr:glucokinase [Anaerolineae bacterium]
MLLAGDIGGTKTSLALFSPERGPHHPVVARTFPSAHYLSLGAVVRAFLAQTDVRAEQACFGVAGPVVGGRATVTNLPWEMDELRLAREFGFARVHLLNDLESIANAVPMLEPADLHTLNAQEPAPGGAIAVIAPGTGLGEAYLTWDGARYDAHASEGGHTDFAPSGALQEGLLSYLREIHRHVSWERVCSGMGIPNIYAYLKAIGYANEPTWFADMLAAARDATPVIITNALDPERRSALCWATLQTFVSILGAEAGNLALKMLATGGVYLGGGIPPRVLSALDSGLFMASFCDKGRFAGFMSRIPVHVILNPQAALLGAARYGLDAWQRDGASSGRGAKLQPT